ncbi:MAG: outer membrane beta-barrel protein [Myxococcota bacterium]
MGTRIRTSVVATLVWAGAFAFSPATAAAVPKLDVKVFLGVGSTTLVPRLPELVLEDGSEVGGRQRSSFVSWQGGLSARVRSRKVFGEIGLVFSRFQFEITEAIADAAEREGRPFELDIVGRNAQMNSLDIPITAGYVPYANPLFKLFLYGGWVNKFNIRGFVDTDNTRRGLKFKPKDIPGFPLVIYQAGMRLGVQFDIGPVNVDFNYTIGLNSISKTEFRTNSHVTQLNLGWLF